MPAGRYEAVLVEPAADRRRRVTVKIEELDAVVPELANPAQHAIQIAGAFIAHGVQHQCGARHAGLPE